MGRSLDGEQAFPKKHLASSLLPKEKLRAVHEYLQGALSLRDTARKYGVGDTSVRKWIVKYNVGGDEAFLSNHTRKHYSKSFQQAVIDYIRYYNGSRYQKRLNCMTPLEYRYYLQNKSA